MVSCKQVSCVEEAVQVRRRSPARCYYGPASDAEFLRSITEKTPGRDDGDAQGHQQMRRRQVYLKSYVFASEEQEEAEAKATRGGRHTLVDAVLGPTMLLRRRKQAHDNRIVGGATCSSKTTCSTARTSSRWCTKKTRKVLSQLLTRLLSSCACNPTAAAAAASASSP